MSTSNETTLGHHDSATAGIYIEDIEELPPLASPGVLSSEQRDEIIQGMREIFREKLQERWGCDEPGHYLCYRAPDDEQHIQLSENHIEVWVDELCQGETTYHDPPIVVKISTNTTSNFSPYRSHAEDWGMISRSLGTSSSVGIGPGYYCGVGLERVGMKVLHSAKKASLMLKVVSSLIEPIVRLILTHTIPSWDLLASGAQIIKLTLNLIAGCSEHESACNTVHSLDTIDTLVSLLPHCDIIRGSRNAQSVRYPLEGLDSTARYFFSVVATPSTRV
ncbi:hypothetical protein BU17DRAFT_90178 [Hysterangium stoloniferum]|nr:hypothetical protein BU17DRAFT_90178 [Hysterangium stoloniferum]